MREYTYSKQIYGISYQVNTNDVFFRAKSGVFLILKY